MDFVLLSISLLFLSILGKDLQSSDDLIQKRIKRRQWSSGVERHCKYPYAFFSPGPGLTEIFQKPLLKVFNSFRLLLSLLKIFLEDNSYCREKKAHTPVIIKNTIIEYLIWSKLKSEKESDL